MAVAKETFTAADVVAQFAPVFKGLCRRSDGSWHFLFWLDGEAVLPDGRRVRIDRHVGMPANECIGRKRMEVRAI